MIRLGLLIMSAVMFADIIRIRTTFTAAVKLRQSAIITHLRNTSDPDVVPLPDNNDDPLEVILDLSLIKILDVDQQKNEIEVVVMETIIWRNPALAWDINKEGFNSSVVTIPAKYLWLPDITVYNAVSSPEFVTPPEAVVFSDGEVYFVPNVRARVWCDLQELVSPSGANCSLKLGSWTQSSETLSLSNRENGISMDTYMAIPQYEILSTFADKHSVVYSCCPETYENIVFKFVIQK